MKVKVTRWGNSLGVRIPNDMADRIGLGEGSRVEMEMKNQRIMLSLARPKYRLEDMLRGMTPKAMREAYCWYREDL